MGAAFNAQPPTDTEAGFAFAMKMIYDSTNGTASRGSIWRAGGEKMGTGQPFYRAAMTQKQRRALSCLILLKITEPY